MPDLGDINYYIFDHLYVFAFIQDLLHNFDQIYDPAIDRMATCM